MVVKVCPRPLTNIFNGVLFRVSHPLIRFYVHWLQRLRENVIPNNATSYREYRIYESILRYSLTSKHKKNDKTAKVK